MGKNRNVSSYISSLVLFNDGKFPHPNTTETIHSAFAEEKSFKKITMTDEVVTFVYKYLDSSFCDLGTFLSFLERRSTYDFVVLLLEECDCERKLLMFLDMLDIKYVSRCEQAYLTVSIHCHSQVILYKRDVYYSVQKTPVTFQGPKNSRNSPLRKIPCLQAVKNLARST